MAELLQRIRTQVNNFVKSLDKRKKIGLALGGLFLVLVMVVIFFITRPTYVTLISGIEYDEMGRIRAKLDEMQIAHKDDGSTTILVDVDDLTDAKVALAMDLQINVPDYTWTNVFADTSFSTSSDVREQQIIQAKVSTLSSALETIEGVEEAVVILDLVPESDFILEKDKDSSASVILHFKRGYEFNQQQVSGVVNLIYTTVSNLPKSNITITDATGRKLNDFTENSESFMMSSQYEQIAMVEKNIEESIHEYLAAWFGYSNLKVGTNVSLYFDDLHTETTTFSPPIEGELTGMLISVTESSSKLENILGAEGVAGTDTNTGDTDYPEGTDGTNKSEQAAKTANYALNKMVQVLDKAKGGVEHVTVTVMINTKNLPNETLTEEENKAVQDMVTAISGLETRSVVVRAVPFADESANYRYKSDEIPVEPGIPIVLVLGILGVVLVGVVIFFVLSRRKATKEKEAEIAAVQAAEEAKRQEELAEIQTDVEDKSSPKYQIEKFIDAKPEAVAALLRSWMTEM